MNRGAPVADEMNTKSSAGDEVKNKPLGTCIGPSFPHDFDMPHPHYQGCRAWHALPESGEGTPQVGGVYTGLKNGCTVDPSGLHECGVEHDHAECVCASCGAKWPNKEWKAESGAGTLRSRAFEEVMGAIDMPNSEAVEMEE